MWCARLDSFEKEIWALCILALACVLTVAHFASDGTQGNCGCLGRLRVSSGLRLLLIATFFAAGALFWEFRIKVAQVPAQLPVAENDTPDR